jgi:hypothetical protein
MAQSASKILRPRPGFALVVAVLVVAAIAATTLVARVGFPWSAASSNTLRSPLRIETLISAHLACPVDPYFSPDGAHVSLLGALNQCPSEDAEDGTPVQRTSWALAIFSTTTGALERVISLDPLLGNREHTSMVTRYASLGWSPDGQRLAVVYTTFSPYSGSQPGGVQDSGLLLVSATTGKATVIASNSGFFSALSGVNAGYPIWDIADGSTTSGYLPDSGLVYAWDQDGEHPAAVQPAHGTLTQLPRIAGAQGRIGDPAGGSLFTLWQPGLVIGGQSVGGGLAQSLFVSLIPTWSEDSMWFSVILAEVALAGSDADQRSAPSALPIAPYPLPATLGVVPSRDAALDAVRRQVGASGWAVVAWNPAGTQLASIACFTTPHPSLEVRDTSAGTLQASVSLTLPPGDNGCRVFGDAETFGAYPHPPLMLRWSLDGTRLLLSDRGASMLTLWTVEKAQPQA